MRWRLRADRAGGWLSPLGLFRRTVRFAWADAEGPRVDLGASATVIDHAMLDALRDVLQGLGAAAPPAVAAG